MSSAYLRLLIFLLAILIPACASSSLAFAWHTLRISYKQGDNIQPWSTPFLICNQSVVPCPLLTVASWPAYSAWPTSEIPKWRSHKLEFHYTFFFVFWLHWSFLLCAGFLSCGEQGSTLYLQCVGFSLQWLLLLQSMASRHPGSVVVAHRLGCPAACGISPGQGSDLCPLPWQVNS